ncbi:MAG: EAL domain-containing protein [Oscillibacter sp.]
MNWLSMDSKKDKRAYRSVMAAFALLCVLVGVLCYGYYLKLQDTIKEESQDYIQEISLQSGNNINQHIEDEYAMLRNLNMVLKQLNVDSYSELHAVVEEQKAIWNFQKILFLDQNGRAYDSAGHPVALSIDQYMQAVIVGKEPVLSAAQVIDGTDSIIFAIPLEDLRIDGVELVAVAAGYDLATFDQLLSMTSFEGRGYEHIIRSDGAIIARSSSPNALQTGYNVLNSLSGAVFYNDGGLEAVRADIAAGKSGNAEFSMGDTREYMTYLALGQQKWSLLTFVPVEVVNTKTNLLLQITLLLCGFVTLAFALLFTFLLLVFYRNKRQLEQIAFVDPVTGGDTIERFYLSARELLNAADGAQYAMVYTNIEKFKVLNEQSGREACDECLRSMEHGIRGDLDERECVGRQAADNFCVLVKYTEEAALVARFDRWLENGIADAEARGIVWLPLIVEFGIYRLESDAMPFPQMIDRAKLSLHETMGAFRGKMRYAIYDEQTRRQLFREKQLEDRMEAALQQREFQVYLQPKYRTQAETVGGAEALVRWMSPTEGMIFPDEFIPLFEKNGFVIPLDSYMFEEVCKTLRRWLDAGLEPVKISVNCSRMHLRNSHFVEEYCRIADAFQIPHQLLEIELSENTVFEDVGHLTDLIREIRGVGFGCSMDDFGSGYSSLNLIQDIPVDTLKLDKVFFRDIANARRNESVIASILTMSRALSMETVAEGVEERQQVEMLKRLNCDFIQGYFFAKPMPVAEFEQLAFGRCVCEKK